MAWKPAAGAFTPGTAGIAALRGRMVQAVQPLEPNAFLGEGRPMGGPVRIERGRTGFVANPWQDGVILAFPERAPVPGTTLEQATRAGRFTSVWINEPTFRARFMIDL